MPFQASPMISEYLCAIDHVWRQALHSPVQDRVDPSVGYADDRMPSSLRLAAWVQKQGARTPDSGYCLVSLGRYD